MATRINTDLEKATASLMNSKSHLHRHYRQKLLRSLGEKKYKKDLCSAELDVFTEYINWKLVTDGCIYNECDL